MKSKALPSIALLAAMILTLAACGGSGGAGEGSTGEAGEDRSFPELEEAAQGSTVRFAMYGGDQATNRYVDEWVTPRLEEKYGITLERVPFSDTADAVNKLLGEKQAGDDEGTIELLWVNGENFYTGAQADLWYGPWAEELPNAEYIDWNSPIIERDFGYPVEGREAPWSQAQFVMIYDSARVEDPPRNMQELLAWAEENPGKFTYPAPPDFTGNAFIEQAFYQTTGQVEPYQGPFDQGIFDEQAPELYDFLNELEPHLWRGGETYPKSSTELDELYQNGQVSFTMSYNPYYAQRQIEKGLFPESTRTYLFEQGTLANTSYVGIPFNSPNKAGAQVATNFLQSPEAQLELQKRHVVGGLSALDLEKLPEDVRQDFLSQASGDTALPLEKLQGNRVPEARSEWLLELEEGWQGSVLEE